MDTITKAVSMKITLRIRLCTWNSTDGALQRNRTLVQNQR